MKKSIIDFLYILKENNNRDWFHANKNLYEDARSDFEQFVEFLIPVIQNFDPRIGNLIAKQTLFRIYRDVRFSKDKTPYKTYFGSYIAPGGRKSIQCGYYMHIEPGNCFLAGGAHRPQGEHLKNIRSEIYYNLKEFEDILNDASFKKTFGQIVGEKLKRPPKGFPADFKGIELLKFKDFRYNRQKGGYFGVLMSKWTKRRLYFSTAFAYQQFGYYLCFVKLNGSRLCWRATCQGYT